MTFSKLQFLDQINHSARVTTEDHAYEIKGAAGLFSWDYLFSLRSPLSVKAGEQVNCCYLLLCFFSCIIYTSQNNEYIYVRPRIFHGTLLYLKSLYMN